MLDEPDVTNLTRVGGFIGVQRQRQNADRDGAGRRCSTKGFVHVTEGSPLEFVIGLEFFTVGEYVPGPDVFPVSGLNSKAGGRNENA